MLIHLLSAMAALSFQLSPANEWEALSPGGGGVFAYARIHPEDPNLIYASSDVAGLIRSDDRGQNWTSVARGLGTAYIQGIDIDPRPGKSNGVYVAASDGVYYSSERGENWLKIGDLGRISGEERTTGLLSDIRVVPDPDGTNVVIYVGTGKWHEDVMGSGEIWVYRNNTWNNHTIGLTNTASAVYSIVCRNPLPNEVWISTGDGIYRSSDYGQNWTDKTDNLPHRNARKMRSHPFHTHELVVVLEAEDEHASGVFYRNRDTKVWEDRTGNLPLTNSTRNIEYWMLDAGKNNFPDTMFVGSNNRRENDGVYQTLDGGTNWALVSQSPNITMGWFNPDVRSWLLEYDEANSGDLIIGGDGRLIISRDNAATFEDITSDLAQAEDGNYGNFPNLANSAFNVTPNRWSAAGESDNMVVRMVTIDPKNSNNIFLSCADNVVFRSNDQGETFQKINFKISGQWVGAAFDVTFHPDVTNRLYALVSKGYGATPGEGGIMQSDDGGNSWSLLAGTYSEIGGLAGGQPIQLVFGPLDGSENRRMFASIQEGGIFESSDNGITWSLVGLQNARVRQIIVNPVDENMLIAGVTGGADTGIWKLTKNGGVWNASKTLPNVLGWNVQARSGIIYFAATSDGLYRSTDQGETWSKRSFPESSSTEKMWGLWCDGAKIYTTQHGDNANIWRSENGGYSWIKMTRNLDNPRALWMTIGEHAGKRWLYAATQGSGTWRVELEVWE